MFYFVNIACYHSLSFFYSRVLSRSFPSFLFSIWTSLSLLYWWDETARSSISHGLVSKIKPNLPLWGIKRELRGVMVNKGRIHREFRYFRDIFWNLVKLDNELRWEIRENGVFRKKTSKRIHGIKNHRIWTWFRGEIEIWSGEKFSDVKIVILS